MAGGKGTRLASITKDIPKPMVPIEGKPLLEYQIDNLKKSGFTDIILIIGHLGSVIRTHFGDGSAFGVSIRYFEETAPLGTAGALSEIKDLLSDTFLLVFGDLFLDVSFDRFFRYHQNQGAKITLFAHPNSHPYDSDLILAEENGLVTGWSGKKEARTEDYKNLVNAGLYVLSKEVTTAIEEHQLRTGAIKTDLEKDVILPLISSRCVFAYRSTEYVKDLGTPERLQKVTADYKNKVCEKRNLKNPQKCLFLDRDGTILQYVRFLRSREEVQLCPSAAEAIRLINESEFLAIVITNQPVIARGECTFDELDRIHDRMYTLLGNEGAYLDGLYFCPHHPDKGFEGEVPELKIVCECRKPKTGMLKQAEAAFHADLAHSWFIGDTRMDVQTGFNAGMQTVLLRTGAPKKGDFEAAPTFEAEDLLDAVKQILSRAPQP